MARKKAHRQQQSAQQQQSALVPTLSLDELLARAQTADKGYVKAYLDAGGSPTMMVSVTANNPDKTKLVVPLLHAMCMCNHKNHKDLKGSVSCWCRQAWTSIQRALASSTTAALH
jgi:hypothetical protein